MSVAVHACTEHRKGVWTHTFCGLEVRQCENGLWLTRRNNLIDVTAQKKVVHCLRCERAMA